MNTDILFLRRSDVAKLMTLPDCLTAMKNAFRTHAEGQVLPPALMHVDATGGEFHIKGGGLQMERTYFGLKANGGFFSNRQNFGMLWERKIDLTELRIGVILSGGNTESVLSAVKR